MNGLFQFRTSSAEIFGEVRESSELLLGRPNGKGKFGSTELSLPQRSGKFGRIPFSVPGNAQGRRFENLRDQAERLMNEIDKAEAESSKQRAIQEPFSDAFHNAHATLEALIQSRKSGTPVAKRRMIAAYDVRVATGHAWYPHRERYQATLRWLKTLRTELKDINARIGS